MDVRPGGVWKLMMHDLGGKTRLTMRMGFPSAEARDEVIEAYGAIEGGKQTLDRLEEFLAKRQAEQGH